MHLEKLKSLFLRALIGCLIAAASLAVVTILAGQFNDISGKALFTILLIALHCLVSFSFIVNNEKQETFESLNFFSNATFIIIVLSFITSVLGVWSVLPGELVWRLYEVYFVLLFAVLHGEVLAKTLGKQSAIDNVVYANFCFMSVVVVMLMVVIFVGSSDTLGAFYYRLLAAIGIVDATLTLIAVIMHKLYLQKHPQITDNLYSMQVINPGQPNQQLVQVPNAQQPKRGMNIFVVLLVGYVVLQIIGFAFMAVIGGINR